jgi:phage repressor protein C with HTH and peptisase S24 domain
LLTKGFAARIRARAEQRGLTQADLHRATGISRQALSDYFKGGKVVGTDGLFALADALHVDPRWLIHGDQQKSSTEPLTTNFDQEKGALTAANPASEGSGVPVAMRDAALAERLGLKLIPEVEITYSLGGGSLAEDYPDSKMVPFRQDWLERLTRGFKPDVFLARGQGDSMMPTILDDDDVLVNRADNVVRQQDRIWALGYGELGMIKRVRRLPTGLFQLNSDNPAVSAIEATEDELFVVGRVIWIGRRV